jgi:protoporphyrinogen oxidase
VWEFQLQGKFGDCYKEVNLAWFWARIYARTTQLAYFDGGFQAFIDALAHCLRNKQVTIHCNATVSQIRPLADGACELHFTAERPPQRFDQVLSTLGPTPMQHMAPQLPAHYLTQLSKLRSLGAVVLTLALDRKLTDNMYWISLPKREGIPLLAMVEHTNMIDPVHYAGDHLLYLGDYLPPDHRFFAMTAQELTAELAPYLTRFNPNFQPSWITGAWVHKAKYAQPTPPVGYLAMIPDLRTPLPGLYYASMSQVYPWDRGTNYAVELGRKVAKLMIADMH